VGRTGWGKRELWDGLCVCVCVCVCEREREHMRAQALLPLLSVSHSLAANLHSELGKEELEHQLLFCRK
jgi:hypothetical protein